MLSQPSQIHLANDLTFAHIIILWNEKFQVAILNQLKILSDVNCMLMSKFKILLCSWFSRFNINKTDIIVCLVHGILYKVPFEGRMSCNNIENNIHVNKIWTIVAGSGHEPFDKFHFKSYIYSHHTNCSMVMHECHRSRCDLLLGQKYLVILNEYKRADYYYYHKCKWQCVRIKMTDTSNYCHCICMHRVIAPEAIYCLQCITLNEICVTDTISSSQALKCMFCLCTQTDFLMRMKLNGTTIVRTIVVANKWEWFTTISLHPLMTMAFWWFMTHRTCFMMFHSTVI